MEAKKVNQILKIAKMYYEMELSQQEIAKRENLSKSSISRLLSLAKELGFVKISVEKPLVSMADLEDRIEKKFGLRKVVVAPQMIDDEQVNFQDVCRLLGQDLGKYIKDQDTLTVAWGATLTEVTKRLDPYTRSGIKIVQANGGMSRIIKDYGNERIITRLCKGFDAQGYQIPAPVIVDQLPTAEALRQDHQIREVLELAEQADVGLWSVGRVSEKSLLFQLGQFEKEYFSKLKKRAVGDVCSHYLNIDGEIADPCLDGRIIAADPEKLKKIPTKIIIASGVDKARALTGALHGKFCDILYIDEKLAHKLK